MPYVFVLIVVREMRIQLVTREGQICFGIVGRLPGILDAGGADIENLLRSVALRIRQRHGPVVGVVPDSADQPLFGHDLHHALQIVFEPVLGRNRARTRRVLVLVVVHQHDSVCVCRFERQHFVVGAGRNVDVQPQVFGGQIGVQFRHQCLIAGLGIIRDILKIKRDTVIARIGRKKPV